RVRNVVSDVGHLARVGDQVVQLLFRGHDPVRRAGGAQAVVVVVDVLVRGGAHAVVGGGVVLGVVVLPVAVVDGLSPVVDLCAAQLRQEAAALLVGEVLGGAAGDLEQGGGEVDVRDDVGDAGAGGDLRGPAHQHRHGQGLVQHQPLVEPAVVAEEEPLVGGVDDE